MQNEPQLANTATPGLCLFNKPRPVLVAALSTGAPQGAAGGVTACLSEDSAPLVVHFRLIRSRDTTGGGYNCASKEDPRH